MENTLNVLNDLLAALERAGVVNIYLHTAQFRVKEHGPAYTIRAAYAECKRPLPSYTL